MDVPNDYTIFSIGGFGNNKRERVSFLESFSIVCEEKTFNKVRMERSFKGIGYGKCEEQYKWKNDFERPHAICNGENKWVENIKCDFFSIYICI